tara:strand:+ start:193 stop:513 length:321 start_codon:yes stop_codon:yes gene_type:complete
LADIKTYFKQPKGWRKDKKYLEAVKTLPCAVCGTPFTDPPHHRIGDGIVKGMGQKAPDFESMPLCRTHHTAVHDNPHNFDQVQYIKDARKILVNKGLIEDVYPEPK